MPIGELAALGTASCWAVTSLAFAEASRRVGALRVNLLRLPMAFVLLSLVVAGRTAPFHDLNGPRLGFLAASAVIGLVAGDLAFFGALRRLGPRLTSLLMSLAPIFAAMAGIAMLSELPGTWAVAGIVLTLGGVAWVVLEQRQGQTSGRQSPLGLVLGLVGAACQGFGLALAKLGMDGEVTPLVATWVRIGVATFAMWAAALAVGATRGLGLAAALRSAGSFITTGAVFGPFVGVWLSLTAARFTAVGVAATIMATTPILLIPLVMITERYRPTIRALLGTLVAVLGVALLFSR